MVHETPVMPLSQSTTSSVSDASRNEQICEGIWPSRALPSKNISSIQVRNQSTTLEAISFVVGR